MERRYIYKLYFRNGCTYIGKHTQHKENDNYITSSAYYNKHKDLLEKREIILDNIDDAETLDIMETICILADKADNDYNCNYNFGAWMNSAKFDNGLKGPANGMFGKKHQKESLEKMRKAWTKERKEDLIKRVKARSYKWVSEMNKTPEHIEKVKSSLKEYYENRAYIFKKDRNIILTHQQYMNFRNHYGKFDIVNNENKEYTTISDEQFKEWSENYNYRNYVKVHKILGRHWFNNGKVETYCFECPQGYIKGRLKFSKEWHENLKAGHAKSEKVKEAIERMKGKPSPNKGKKMSEEQRRKLFKPVKDEETGIYYDSVQDTITALNISKATFYKWRQNGRFKFERKENCEQTD